MASRVPKYVVKIDGEELTGKPDFDLQVVKVDLRRQAPASFELRFDDQEGKYDADGKMAPGKPVEIQLGYEGEETKPVFKGEIVSSHLSLAENGPRTFNARGFDFLHRATRSRKTRTFLNQKFSDIVTQVLQDHGLGPASKFDDTSFVRDYVLQHNQTDLDFIRGIAGWLDFDLCIDHKDDPSTVRFCKPDVGGSAELKMVYETPNFGAGEVHLRRFDGRLSMVRVVSEVIVRGWDPAKKEKIEGRATSGKLYGAMGGEGAPDAIPGEWGTVDRQLVDYKVFSQEEADKIAETKLNEYARTLIRADIEIEGHPDVHPGRIIEIQKAGDRYDGPYLVESATHMFTSKVRAGGGYTTRCTVARCGW